MTVSYDENDKIAVIDFSPFLESSDDEINQKLQDQQDLIDNAKVVWIVNVHIRPGLILLVAKYIDFRPDQIKFISKDFLLNMQLIEKNRMNWSKLPHIDSHIEEIYEDKPMNNLFDKPKLAVQFNGYTISMTNIQMIRKYLRKNVNLEIKDWNVTRISYVMHEFIRKSTMLENQREMTVTEQK